MPPEVCPHRWDENLLQKLSPWERSSLKNEVWDKQISWWRERYGDIERGYPPSIIEYTAFHFERYIDSLKREELEGNEHLLEAAAAQPFIPWAFTILARKAILPTRILALGLTNASFSETLADWEKEGIIWDQEQLGVSGSDIEKAKGLAELWKSQLEVLTKAEAEQQDPQP